MAGPFLCAGFWMSTGFELDSMAALARKGLPMLYSVLQLAHPGGFFFARQTAWVRKGKHASKLVLDLGLQTQTQWRTCLHAVQWTSVRQRSSCPEPGCAASGLIAGAPYVLHPSWLSGAAQSCSRVRAL